MRKRMFLIILCILFSIHFGMESIAQIVIRDSVEISPEILSKRLKNHQNNRILSFVYCLPDSFFFTKNGSGVYVSDEYRFCPGKIDIRTCDVERYRIHAEARILSENNVWASLSASYLDGTPYTSGEMSRYVPLLNVHAGHSLTVEFLSERRSGGGRLYSL